MDPLKPLIDSLNADGRPRVWSLVITVFGDCVQQRGRRVATQRLSRLLGRIGIETGALRTALSRLASDGWVESTRSGRTSSYSLTPRGLAEFGPATARIYAPPSTGPEAWVFETRQSPRALRVAGGWLRPAPPGDAATGFRLTGQLDPQGAGEIWQALDPAHRVALERLTQDLAALDGFDAPPLDCAAARVLLIHRWRRLILLWPPVPPEALPCRDLHARVARAYAQLTPGAEAWLDSGDPEMPALPPARPEARPRFA